jgi:hypothetical protein
MISLISSEVAGEKTDSRGGVSFGREKGLRDGVGSFEQSIAILLLKNVKNDLQRSGKLLKAGRAGLSLRPRRSFIVDQSFLG